MAHAKSVNRKKNFEDMTDSPRHMPIGGERPRERDEVIYLTSQTYEYRPPLGPQNSGRC